MRGVPPSEIFFVKFVGNEHSALARPMQSQLGWFAPIYALRALVETHTCDSGTNLYCQYDATMTN
jgi:hypothetical protein